MWSYTMSLWKKNGPKSCLCSSCNLYNKCVDHDPSRTEVITFKDTTGYRIESKPDKYASPQAISHSVFLLTQTWLWAALRPWSLHCPAAPSWKGCLTSRLVPSGYMLGTLEKAILPISRSTWEVFRLRWSQHIGSTGPLWVRPVQQAAG